MGRLVVGVSHHFLQRGEKDDTMGLKRRDFIKHGVLGLSAWGAFSVTQLCADPYGLPIGIQLYTVRDHLQKDLLGTFQRVGEIGYKVVEIGGTSDFYGMPPAKLKSTLSNCGLEPVSIHFSTKQLKSNLEKVIADSRQCGLTYIGLSALESQDRKSGDAIRRNADWFNQVGEAVAKSGAHFFYHGHNFDFASVDGKVEYDELIQHTDPKLVSFQIDCFWCVRAGKDPVDYFNRFPGRFPQLHIKDLKPGIPPSTGGNDRPDAFTEVGHGVIDWPRIFKAAPKGGLKHYYVEQDRCDGDSLESARISYEYLHKLTV